MINIISNSLIIFSALANFLIGLVVLNNNIKGKVNIAFSVICFMLSIWGIFLFLYGVPFFLSSFFWIKAAYALVTIQISFILGFSFIFPKPIFKNWRLPAILFSLFFIGISYWWLFFTNDWIINVTLDPQKGLHVALGDIYKVWSVLVWIAFGWALFNFIRNSKKCALRERIQLQYLFFGFGLWGVFVSIPDIILPIFFAETRFFPLSVVTSLFFSIAVSYAIIKHHFMDIRMVVARTVAYTLLLAIIGIFYVVSFYSLSYLFLGTVSSGTQVILNVGLALVVAFTFDRLKVFLEKLTDKIFYQGHYDTQSLLSSVSTILSTNIDLTSLVNQILGLLIKQIKVSKGALVLPSDSSIYETISVGFDGNLNLTYQHISPFLSQGETIVFDELEEGDIKQLMRLLNASIVRLLKIENKVIGLLILGEKSSGDVYSQQDLKILNIISPEMAVAVQNSLSYEKIKKFNEVLSEEVKNATLDLQRANERLKNLDRLKDDFVSIASHELRTPMTAIRSYAWMALNRSDVKLSEKLQKYLVRVLISAERLINLVNDLLNISRIEAGRIEISPEPVDLISLCKDITDEVYFSKSTEKDIKFELSDKYPVPRAFADPEKLRQVLLNLVGNSLKFTPNGGKIGFRFFSDGKTVEISVSDTGVGISKEDMSKLFQKFSRLDSSYTAAATSGGTGLGLFISKSLVNLMHGKIWATSEGLGKGAAFTISLPVATQEVLQNADEFKIKSQGEAKGLEPVAI